MASEADASYEDEYEEEPAMVRANAAGVSLPCASKIDLTHLALAQDELLTERLEEAQALHVDTADREQESVSAANNGDTGTAGTTSTDVREEHGCKPSVFESDEVNAEAQQLCWNTVRSSTATLMKESVQHTQQQQLQSQRLSRKQNDEPTRRRKLTNSKEQQQIQSLTRKLGQYQKLNAKLHHQLQLFYKNEAVAQLENRNKEKQLQIDQLLHENRMLLHQQRLLTKQVEELQESKDNFPLKKYALQEELRICKERLRQYKERQKEGDEKSFRLHQQAVDLATKNKTLTEKLKKFEAVAATALTPSASAACIPAPPSTLSYTIVSSSPLDAESITTSQEDEITRLQQRVALMKKTQRSDKLKQERQLKASQGEVEQARAQLETFYQQLSTKEKAIRSLFLQMKKLKRAVQDLTNAQQTNQHMQQMVFGREVRFSQNHSPHSHSPRNHNNHSHHQASQQQLGHSNHATSASSTQSFLLPFPAASKKVVTDRIHDTLRQLGYIPSFASSRKLSVMPKRKFKDLQGEGSGGVSGIGNVEDDEEEDLSPNCVQGKLIPCPPPSSTNRKMVVRSGTPTSRSQFYSALSPPSRENSRHASLEVALDVESERAEDGIRTQEAYDDFGIRASEESDMEGGNEGEEVEDDDPGVEGQQQYYNLRSRMSEDEVEASALSGAEEEDD